MTEDGDTRLERARRGIQRLRRRALVIALTLAFVLALLLPDRIRPEMNFDTEEVWRQP